MLQWGAQSSRGSPVSLGQPPLYSGAGWATQLAQLQSAPRLPLPMSRPLERSWGWRTGCRIRPRYSTQRRYCHHQIQV